MTDSLRSSWHGRVMRLLPPQRVSSFVAKLTMGVRNPSAIASRVIHIHLLDLHACSCFRMAHSSMGLAIDVVPGRNGGGGGANIRHEDRRKVGTALSV